MRNPVKVLKTSTHNKLLAENAELKAKVEELERKVTLMLSAIDGQRNTSSLLLTELTKYTSRSSLNDTLASIAKSAGVVMTDVPIMQSN